MHNSVYQASPWGEGPGNEAKGAHVHYNIRLEAQVPFHSIMVQTVMGTWLYQYKKRVKG